MIVPTSNSWCRARFPPYHLGHQTWLNKNNTITIPEWYIKGPASSNVQKQPNHCIFCHSILQPRHTMTKEAPNWTSVESSCVPPWPHALKRPVRVGGVHPSRPSIFQEPAWMSLTFFKILEWFYRVLNRFYPELNPQNCFRIGNTCYSSQSCPCLLDLNLLPISLLKRI